MKELYKVYEVLGPFTESEIAWLTRSDIGCTIESDMSGINKLTLFVNDDKQDTWLNLYWSDKIYLVLNMYSAMIKYDDTN